MFEQRLTSIFNLIKLNPEYDHSKYPNINTLYWEVKELLITQLTTDFDDNNNAFFMNLTNDEKLTKYSEFMFDMYRWFLEYPGIDIVAKWTKEYNFVSNQTRTRLGLLPPVDKTIDTLFNQI